MSNITVKLNKGDYFNRENIDHALKRLKGKVDHEEILDTIKRKRSFETKKQTQIRKMKRLHRMMKQNKNRNRK